MDIRLLLIDLDGTLLRRNKTVSGRTLDTLERCRTGGIRLALATARLEAAAARIIRLICPDAVISCGGAMARKGGELVYERRIPADTADALAAACLEEGACRAVTVQTPSGYYVSYAGPAEHPDYAHGVHHDFHIPLRRDVYKLCADFENPAVAARVAGRFPSCDCVAFAGESWVRFAHAEAAKLPAAAAVAAALGVPMEKAAAFGDDIIDLPLLAGCGAGVAVDNALPAVKAAARFRCPSNEEDGVARWLEENLLEAL